jgi:ABC-2 type transport system permease protein
MQQFIYQMKRILRNPNILFWAMAFPIILGTLFYFMFGNIENASLFAEIPVGIVEKEENTVFVDMMEQIEIEDGVPMFQVSRFDTREAAELALREESIQGIVLIQGEDIDMVVKESSTAASLLKTFLDQYQQNMTLLEDMAVSQPEKVEALAAGLYQGSTIEVQPIALKGQDKSPYTQYFYALLAMACLIASSIGINIGINIQADQSALGARRNVAPTKKMHQLLIDFAAYLIVYCVMMTIVVAVFIFIFKQDFGSNIPLVLLGTWVGSFVGLACGTMISVVLKGDKAAKNGISSVFFVVSSFLGGLQWGDITYYLEKGCPIVNRINPATLMVNAFQSLSVFGDYRSYAWNLVTLLVIGLIFLAVSIWKLRRTRYASI